MLQAEILNRRTLEGTSLVLGLDQSHALEAFGASMGNVEDSIFSDRSLQCSRIGRIAFSKYHQGNSSKYQ